MAIVVDKARPANANEVCAMNAFVQPTPRTMVRSFRYLLSTVEKKIPPLSVSVTPVDNRTDNVRFVDFSTFGIAVVRKTKRFA